MKLTRQSLALKYLAAAWLISVTITALSPTALLAAEPLNNGPLSIITSPLPIGLSTDPGKSVTTELRVKNNGSAPERLKIDLMKF
ncbi:MAG TPA: hypothetical protein VFK94_02755, partial [Patescibacteria group bacterium]|nr:hypothetical protein [Patescibacteria group bacterium]